MATCLRCSCHRFVEDRNGFDVCTGCGLVFSLDRLSDKNSFDNKLKDNYSVFDNDDSISIVGVINDISPVYSYYNRKTKYFIEVISNYTTEPYYKLDKDLLLSIKECIINIKNNVVNSILGQELFDKFKSNPNKKNTFKLLRFITLPQSLLKRYRSRITKKPLKGKN